MNKIKATMWLTLALLDAILAVYFCLRGSHAGNEWDVYRAMAEFIGGVILGLLSILFAFLANGAYKKKRWADVVGLIIAAPVIYFICTDGIENALEASHLILLSLATLVTLFTQQKVQKLLPKRWRS
ncbi:hypothetical protein IPG41_04140 [Candidatus Peregrinibacteria bacterium]|nr:MAG: hypothetical protein IPG41_04140 [Candidatus Peregrinibacteria bacterium]